MKTTTLRATLLALTAILALTTSCVPTTTPFVQRPTNGGVGAESVITEIQYALDRLKSEVSSPALPPFKEAQIELLTERVVSGNINASVVLFSGSASRAQTSATKLSMTLIPKSGRNTKSLTPRVGDQLVDQMKEAIRAVEKQRGLDLKKLAIEGNLSLTYETNARYGITFAGVSIEGSPYTNSRTGLHKMTLIFER
ncbi:MAG: hypothetical protein AAGC74_09410 [Verrucomicrobiota bacterium]